MNDITRLPTVRLLLRRPVASDSDGYFAIYGDLQFLDRWETYGWGTWAVSNQERPDELLGVGIMYEADLYKGVGNAKVCQ